MTDIRTVCTHDAKKLADTLVRLLEAEQHAVRLTYGRQSLAELEAAKEARDAVLIIWSPDAPSQTYMLEWARNIAPERLIEIALAPGWPRIDRKAPVIDFTTWRGERGARAWNALNDRLRAVARALEPPKPPPKRAALALGLASVAAVGVAAVVRMNEPADAPALAEEPLQTAHGEEPLGVGVGGPLDAVEPPSADEPLLQRLPNPRFSPLQPIPEPDLMEIEPYTPPEIRDPTLMERLRALNPLRGDRSDQG
jgi:hypothetical protein